MKYERQYEDESIEFKKSLGQLDRGIESLTAMLNKHGVGKIVFGVLDDGEIEGVKDIGQETIKKIATKIKENVSPSIVPDIKPKCIDDKTVIEITAKGDKKPYSCFGLYLIRVGSENKKILPDQLGDLFFTNSNLSCEKIESLNQDLTFNGLKSLYISRGFSIDNKTFAKNMGLLTSNGKYNYIAEILADNNNCSIKVVRFKGEDKTEMISRNEFGYKCMLIAMKQAYDYTSSFNETRVDLNSGLERKELKLFDEKCLDEAWLNACLHNRWARNVPPAIYIFSDRIEVVSTGGLPLDFSKEEFFEGVSHPINMNLMKIMGQLDYIEQTGHGVPLIVSKYGKKAFELYENHIIVRIPFAFVPSFNQLSSDLSSSHNRILTILNENPTMTLNELVKLSGLGRTRINQIISDLKKIGKIERSGNNRIGYWKVNK